MRCGLHGSRLAQLITLRHFRPQATVATRAQGDHIFHVSTEELSSKAKLRLDAYLAAKLPQSSRARLQASIKEGLVSVNGRPQAKASYAIRTGDVIACNVLPPPPLEANPEDIPLEIVYEDEHLLVINKAADMVMHPSPGHYTGTLVNALLHHCGLPPVRVDRAEVALLSLQPPPPHPDSSLASLQSIGVETVEAAPPPMPLVPSISNDARPPHTHNEAAPSGSALPLGGPSQAWNRGVDAGSPSHGESDYEDDYWGDYGGSPSRPFEFASPASRAAATIRPGIVHRLDKGTTGLLVVAKDDATQLSLAKQFKDRTVQRQYWAITLGVPSPREGRVAANVGRDLRDRKKMATFAYASARGRTAASKYTVLQPLAEGGAALVQWRLETGRTHQIRVHAKHVGHPLLGDETYGGGAAAAAAAVTSRRKGSAASQRAEQVACMHRVIAGLGRPALHAKTLGFVHPATGELLQFDSELPADFSEAMQALCRPPFTSENDLAASTSSNR